MPPRANATAKKIVLTLNKVLTATFFIAYALLVGFAVFKRYAPEHQIKILGAPALCLLLVTALRHMVNRPRPYSDEGAKIVPLEEKKTSENKSFPSRHLACAAVITATVLPYFPLVGCILAPLTLVLGYIRFIGGWHYPSDLLAGILVGALCGVLPLFF
jgi:membrane-associated phospholipid phosphatase